MSYGEVHGVHIGEFRIDHIVDGSGSFEPTASFRSTTPEQWEAHRDLLDADGKLPFTMGAFLVRRAGRTVLVDLGLGRDRLMGITGGAMLDRLADAGVTPDEVTDVVFTHLHTDHIGWASVEGRATFPNATHRCSSADWNHFVVEHPGREAERLAPVAGRLETWDGSGTILPGIDALAAPGHTPGSTVVVLSSGDERAMLLGDVVHCPVQLVDDEWEALFDVDPELARRTRTALAREIEQAGVRVAGAHFPEMRFGRLLRAQGRRRFAV